MGKNRSFPGGPIIPAVLLGVLKLYAAGRPILIHKKGRIIAGNKSVEQARAAGPRASTDHG